MPVVEKSARALPLFRSIISEFRKTGNNFAVRSTPHFKFCSNQLRSHQLTQKKLCKAPNEIEHIADTYATYLRSTRLLAELQEQYKGGDRDIEKTANVCGLTTHSKKSKFQEANDKKEK